MGETNISWCDHSINPIRARHKSTKAVGHYCEKISPGCRNCYASKMQPRFQMPFFQAQQVDGNKANVQPFFVRDSLLQVSHRKKPTKYLWADMTDLFGSWVHDLWIEACFAIMAATPQHTHMVLTKRPDRMALWATRPHLLQKLHEAQGIYGLPSLVLNTWPLPNVWCGVSVENQEAAAHRIPLLSQVPATIRFLSVEPLLETVNLAPFLGPGPEKIHWVIIGGESGPQARECQTTWIAAIIKVCEATGTACFVKQMGSHGHTWGDPKGADPREWPPALQVQNFPQPSHV